MRDSTRVARRPGFRTPTAKPPVSEDIPFLAQRVITGETVTAPIEVAVKVLNELCAQGLVCRRSAWRGNILTIFVEPKHETDNSSSG